jgi:hypothetical protein
VLDLHGAAPGLFAAAVLPLCGVLRVRRAHEPGQQRGRQWRRGGRERRRRPAAAQQQRWRRRRRRDAAALSCVQGVRAWASCGSLGGRGRGRRCGGAASTGGVTPAPSSPWGSAIPLSVMRCSQALAMLPGTAAPKHGQASVTSRRFVAAAQDQLAPMFLFSRVLRGARHCNPAGPRVDTTAQGPSTAAGHQQCKRHGQPNPQTPGGQGAPAT